MTDTRSLQRLAERYGILALATRDGRTRPRVVVEHWRTRRDPWRFDGYWLIAHRDDAQRALRSEALGPAHPYEIYGEDARVWASNWLMFETDAHHRTDRAAWATTLRDAEVLAARLLPSILAELVPAGFTGRADLMEAVIDPLLLKLLGALTGWSAPEARRAVGLSRTLSHLFDPLPHPTKSDQVAGALAGMRDLVLTTLERDGTTSLARLFGVIHDSRGREEACASAALFVGTFWHTTRTHLATLILVRSEGPRADADGLIGQALALYPPVLLVTRKSIDPLRIGTCEVPPGEYVLILLMGEVTAGGVKHLAFGAGPHTCVGLAIARIVAKAFVAAMRLTEVRPLVHLVTWGGTTAIREVDRLDVSVVAEDGA